MLRARQGERGFALVLVLWSAALLALFGTQVGLAGRSAVQLTRNLVTSAQLQSQADAAVAVTIFRLLGGALDDAQASPEVEVVVSEEAGKINPNIVSAEVLQGLLLAAGADPELADRILDWRTSGRYPRRHGAKADAYLAQGRLYGPPGTPIRELDELGLVLGLSATLVDALKPDLTLIHLGDPVPALAGSRVLAALESARKLSPDAAPPLRDPARAVCITAAARGAGGAMATRRACVRLDPRYPGQPWRVLDWATDPLPP